jgi:predicted lipoprotein with Yx(FWY)xxD motif
MKIIAALLAAALVTVTGCGGDSKSSSPPTSEAAATTDATPTTETKAAAKPAAGTTIKLRGSDFGPMLFDSNRQAIYIFQNDGKGKSVCYDDCAKAWPPVFTSGKPKAGKGVRASLLGTAKRRDGKRQVTYAGKPLYFYAHEGPGQVLCHNVHLNGGLWWVVGPDGKRRPA